MHKRLIGIAVTVVVLVLGQSGTVLASHTTDTRTRRSDSIWEGLCVGASLNISETSRLRCRRAIQSVQSDHPDTQPQPAPPRIQYAVLGDSVAAGLGLPVAPQADERCGRSLESYGYAVAARHTVTATHIACSGATMGDLFTKQRVRGPDHPAQLDTAFAGGTPDIITITAGANDIRWENFLTKCWRRTCGTAADERIVHSLLAALELETRYVFTDIKRRSGGSPPKVILTGYYNPLSDSCMGREPRLTNAEITWIQQKMTALNQTLENVASQSGFAIFASVDFSGHDLCSGDPWIQTLDGEAPFHPTARGQAAIADAVLRVSHP